MCVHLKKLHACFVLRPSLSPGTLRLEGLSHLTDERRGPGEVVRTKTQVSYLFYKYLLFSDQYARHCRKHLTYAGSLPPHSKPVEHVLYCTCRLTGKEHGEQHY